jgi:hypothetical protein
MSDYFPPSVENASISQEIANPALGFLQIFCLMFRLQKSMIYDIYKQGT